MAHLSLEERVALLEQQVASLRQAQKLAFRPKDWRRTIGMFTNDPGMRQLFQEALKIREADRDRARRSRTKTRRTKP
jgi:hypothetical protein